MFCKSIFQLLYHNFNNHSNTFVKFVTKQHNCLKDEFHSPLKGARQVKGVALKTNEGLRPSTLQAFKKA